MNFLSHYLLQEKHALASPIISREVVERTFDGQDVQILESQLYPTFEGALQVDSSRRLRDDTAQRAPELVDVAVANGYEPIDLEIGGEKALGFRTQVLLKK